MLPDKNFLLRLAQSELSELHAPDLELVSMMNRNRVRKPLIMVNSSTSGIVAGANETLGAIEQYVGERAIDIELCESG
ncbi:MAG: hypothetical protein KAT15_13410, partial [Bacteroidales bacterium]|nr:hypothetical protein [Bacteroidales bacterium]